MAHQEALARAIASMYVGQVGKGSIPVYSGAEFQYGAGFADILRSVWRYVVPIFAPVAAGAASKFITSTAQSLNEGHSLRDATRNAFKPTLSDAITNSGQALVNKLNQSGNGRKRKRTTRKAKTSRPRVYKGAGKRVTKPKPKRSKKSKQTFKNL